MTPAQATIVINLLSRELEGQKETIDDLLIERNNLFSQLEKQREKHNEYKEGTAEELFKTLKEK